MNNIYIIGDSWSSGWNSDTNQDHQGYGEILGIPPERNLAIAGSTAEEWATKYADKITSIPEDATVVMSLGGNDLIKALSDGKVDPVEVVSICNSIIWVDRLLGIRKIIYIAYANPYPNRPDITAILNIASSLVRGVVWMSKFIWCSDFLKPEHFSNGDFHPNTKGYELIAENIKRELKGVYDKCNHQLNCRHDVRRYY